MKRLRSRAPMAAPSAWRRAGGTVVGLALVLANVSCVSKVTMTRAEGDDGARPHTVILYSGVRDSSRQYADYGVVDASILDE